MKCSARMHLNRVYMYNECSITNTVVCKPKMTNKHTSTSGFNAYGHEQILVGAWLHRQHVVTGVYMGIMFSRAEKKGSGSTSLSQPKTRTELAQDGVSPTVDPTHDPGTQRATPKPRRRRPRRRHCEEASSLENLPVSRPPQAHPSPKYLFPYSPQNLENTPHCKDKPAPHPSTWEHFVRERSSRKKPLPPKSNTQWNASTSYLLVILFVFVVVVVAV